MTPHRRPQFEVNFEDYAGYGIRHHRIHVDLADVHDELIAQGYAWDETGRAVVAEDGVPFSDDVLYDTAVTIAVRRRADQQRGGY